MPLFTSQFFLLHLYWFSHFHYTILRHSKNCKSNMEAQNNFFFLSFFRGPPLALFKIHIHSFLSQLFLIVKQKNERGIISFRVAKSISLFWVPAACCFVVQIFKRWTKMKITTFVKHYQLFLRTKMIERCLKQHFEVRIFSCLIFIFLLFFISTLCFKLFQSN